MLNKKSVFLTILVVFAFVVSAYATSISSTFVYEEQNTASDTSFEYLINSINSVGVDTTVDVGDSLRGILRIDQVINSNGISLFTKDWTSELTAIFEATVVAKTFDGTSYNWAFAPNANFEGIYGSGSMIAVFEDPLNDFEGVNVPNVAAGEATATNGTPYWTLGYAGLAGEGWVASAGTDDLTLLSAFSGAANAGTLNFSLSLLDNLAGPLVKSSQVSTIDGFSLVDFTGNGNFLSPGILPTPFTIMDDVNVRFTPVPEPSTFILLGAGILGLGFWRRNRK